MVFSRLHAYAALWNILATGMTCRNINEPQTVRLNVAGNGLRQQKPYKSASIFMFDYKTFSNRSNINGAHRQQLKQHITLKYFKETGLLFVVCTGHPNKTEGHQKHFLKF
jgi:hypothetical protein